MFLENEDYTIMSLIINTVAIAESLSMTNEYPVLYSSNKRLLASLYLILHFHVALNRSEFHHISIVEIPRLFSFSFSFPKSIPSPMHTPNPLPFSYPL